nr:hypothetical protein [Microctonus hyperodae filamentous virus]
MSSSSLPTCSTCGQTGHVRASSAKCLKRKLPIRQRGLGAGEKNEIYAIKKCLASTICPLVENKAQILEKIRQDVRELSRLKIELAVLVNYFYKSYFLLPTTTRREEFYKYFPKFSPLQFAYVLQRKKKITLADPANVLMKYRQLQEYNGSYRSFVIYELAREYDTIFRTNITTHMFTRIKRYLRLLYPDATPTNIHQRCFEAYYTGIKKTDVIGQFFTQNELNVKAVERDPWRYVYLLMEMQQKFEQTKNERHIQIFPQYSHGLKHITYTTMGLYELLRSIKEPDVPGNATLFRENAAKYWSRYFTLKRNFGSSISTDGVSISLSMNRIIVPGVTIKKRRKVQQQQQQQITVPNLSGENFTRILAVDPGAKTPIVTCDTKLQ